MSAHFTRKKKVLVKHWPHSTAVEQAAKDMLS